MTRFASLWTLLTGEPVLTGAQRRAAEASAAREAAMAAYEDAVERGDTRDQSSAWSALFEATAGKLRLETGR